MIALLPMLLAQISVTNLVGDYTDAEGKLATITYGGPTGLQLARISQIAYDDLKLIGDRVEWSHDGQSSKLQVDPRGNLVSEGKVVFTKSADAYSQIEAQVRSGGVSLAGTLMLPKNASRFGVVLVHGSGKSDRGSLWYFTLADHLARSGISVFFPDKRGSGHSAGDWHTAGFDALAGDSAAEARLLSKKMSDRNPTVGFVGMSQGGWVAPLAAERFSDTAFVVSISCSALPPRYQLRQELKNSLLDSGLRGDDLQKAMNIQFLAERWLDTGQGWAVYLDALKQARREPWGKPVADFPDKQDSPAFSFTRLIINFQPIPVWNRLLVPCLAIYGEKDEHELVPVEDSLDLLRRKAPRVQVKEFADTGHAMGDPNTHWIRKSFLDFLSGWIRDEA